MQNAQAMEYKIQLNGGKVGKMRIYDQDVWEMIETGQYCLLPTIGILKNGEYGIEDFELIKMSKVLQR